MDIGAVNCKGEISWNICNCTYYEEIDANIKPLYTQVTGIIVRLNSYGLSVWIGTCEIRYIFPLGNIYIHTHIIRGSVNYSDNRGGGPTGHPVRDRDAVVGMDPDTLPGRPTFQ